MARHRATPRHLGPIGLRLSESLGRFLDIEAAGGFALLGAAALALIWANSPWSLTYHQLWRAPLPFNLGGPFSAEPLRFWINEGLMTLFFFIVGLEIRRELREGALASLRLAALPAIAALGGMIAPALIYLALNHRAELRSGWAVPTATDIAFALGVLALLGTRVPPTLRVLLLALAIIDDIGAVIIIVCVYSRSIAVTGLMATAYAGGVILLLQRLGMRFGLAFALASIVMWVGLLRAGVHPTIAGVLLGFLIPARARPGDRHARPLAERLEAALHPWVALAVMPLFALANAGVSLGGVSLHAARPRMVVTGIALALVLGKLSGILLTTLLAVKLRVCALPAGLGARWIVMLGLLGGIGFTMALFVAGLAFADPALLAAAKLGILLGSAAAALLAFLAGRLIIPRKD